MVRKRVSPRPPAFEESVTKYQDTAMSRVNNALEWLTLYTHSSDQFHTRLSFSSIASYFLLH